MPTVDVESFFGDVIAFCEEARCASGRVFFHCQYGVSRSAIMVLAYVMWMKGIVFEEAFEQLKKTRPICNPNYGFICQLVEWYTHCQSPVHSLFAVERYNENESEPVVARKKRCECYDLLGKFEKFGGDVLIIRTPTELFYWEKEGARNSHIVVGENALLSLRKTCKTIKGFKVVSLRGEEGSSILKDHLKRLGGTKG